MTTKSSSTRAPAVPASKVSKIKPTKAAAEEATASEAPKTNPNKLTREKMVRLFTASAKRATRLAAFFEPGSHIAQNLRDTVRAFELVALEAKELPDDWKPIRSQTARSFAALTQGGKCRIAKGLVEKYFVLLDDEDGDTVEEKTAALNELLIHKLGEKNSVVRTAAGTRFAINTRHLRTI